MVNGRASVRFRVRVTPGAKATVTISVRLGLRLWVSLG